MKKLFTVILLCISINCYSSNWVKVNNEWEFDTSSIQKKSDGYVRVWSREILSPESISNIVNINKKIGVKEDYSKYSYSLQLYEFDCSQRNMRVLSHTDYDVYKKEISSSETPESKFVSVIPDSVGESGMKFACKK